MWALLEKQTKSGHLRSLTYRCFFYKSELMVNVVNITFYGFLPLLLYTHSNLNIKDIQIPWLIDSISKCLAADDLLELFLPHPDKPPFSRYISNISPVVTHSRFTPDSPYASALVLLMNLRPWRHGRTCSSGTCSTFPSYPLEKPREGGWGGGGF